MKIISLEAENYKRLKAVEITPDGNTIIIGGKNAQGKSSVLDAIWAALGGREGNKTQKPIRDGETKAKVRLDLGDMIVTRTWSGDNSTVKVESADGAVYKSPQALLDGLVGKLSFDPLAFTRLNAKEQRDALIDLANISLDLNEHDAERQAVYDKRADIGRQGKAIGDVAVDESLPETETSSADLIQQFRAMDAGNTQRREAEKAVQAWEEAVAEAEEALARAKESLAEKKKLHADTVAKLNTLPNYQDTSDIDAQLENVESINAAIRMNNENRQKKAHQDQLRADYEALTKKINSLDKKKADALATADFPVEGLGFDENGVTFNNIPFGQASSAEQIRVSLAMAIAANPKLRVVRIMDGSLLDEDSMTLIASIAAENDMQVWVERVGSDGVGVVIEDGQVAK